jgi:RHS repeat-associated protein
MVLGYQYQGHIGYYQNATPHWNGNISWAMYVMSGVNVTPGAPYSPTALVGNTYAYDNAGRILGSNFGFYSQNTGNGVWNWYGTNMYDESGYQYDASGNITSVQRYGSTGALMDNLGYTYATGTNRLRHISDAVAPGTFSSDIDNQVTDNYNYDANGSMQKDLQRDVAFVVNDIHNLPVSMWKASTGQELKYYYDTEGKRIRKDVGSTEYYVNGPGGETEVVVKSDGSGATYNILGRDNLGQVKRSSTTFARFYYLKDHLGTIKMTVDGSCNVVAYDDFYPFGQQMEGRSSASSADARYKYTEKERDSETGYDYFGARYYDARIGRWLSVDPLAEKYPFLTPFDYVANNPIRFVDSHGDSINWTGAATSSLGLLGYGSQALLAGYSIWQTGGFTSSFAVPIALHGAAGTVQSWRNLQESLDGKEPTHSNMFEWIGESVAGADGKTIGGVIDNGIGILSPGGTLSATVKETRSVLPKMGRAMEMIQALPEPGGLQATALWERTARVTSPLLLGGMSQLQSSAQTVIAATRSNSNNTSTNGTSEKKNLPAETKKTLSTP